MLTEDERKREIERRKGAGDLSIPSADDGSGKIQYFANTEHEMRLVASNGIYRVLLSDDIDPDVTAKNVPWVVQKESSEGATHPAIARTLGQFDALNRDVWLKGVNDLVVRHALTVAKTICMCDSLLEQLHTAIEKGAGQVVAAGRSAVSVQPFDQYDSTCRSFFGFAKVAITSCTHLLIDAFGIPDVYPGNWKKAVDALGKLPGCSDASARLLEREPFCKSVTDTRNAIEHPTAVLWFETRNFTLMPDGKVMVPTFRRHEGGKAVTGYMDYPRNAENIVERLIDLAEHTIIEIALSKTEAPWPIVIEKMADDKVDPESPARYRGHIILPKEFRR
ncbi:MAG TPA: hypothetical protein VGO52_14005 [Hyphomonadaceae bacterium]|jgi:hypothetical protein|nr:hypothetical protein [Hyphomonadaceae bacterium]